jgi:predicted dehydrogenase
MGVHAIDTTRYVLGDPRPRSVTAHISTRYIDADVDDTGLIWITWEDGIISYIESGWWQPHANGPEATVELYGTGGYGHTFPAYLDLPSAERTQLVRVDSGFPPVRKEHAPQSLYNDQMAYFLRCVESGDQPSPGGEEGLVNMRIVDAAYESARTGRVVELG